MPPRPEKFSENSFRALSSLNHTWEGVGSEEEDALERRGFWDGVDLCLGAITQTNTRERDRDRQTERQTEKHQQHQYKSIEN